MASGLRPLDRSNRLHGLVRGRPVAPVFDRNAYEQRTTVERCIDELGARRGPAARYDKTATIHLAGLHLGHLHPVSEMTRKKMS